MTTTLTQASRQWAERPPDERYSSLAELHAAVTQVREQAREATSVPYSTLRTQAEGEEVLLVGKANVPSRMTNWAFGQLATRVGAPASYLRELPPTLAVQNLNYGLANRAAEMGKANLLLHSNGGHLVRAFTGPDYTRIWNSDITSRLIRLAEAQPQWQPAPAAFDGSRGLYASDHDLFAFLVDNGRRIFEADPNGGLSRGFFVSNSEVGAKSFWIMTFFYNYICGNHMVWGAKGVRELRIRHVGNADYRAFAQLSIELRKYAEGSAAEDEAKITRARSYALGSAKDEVLDALFGLRGLQVSRKLLAESYDKAELHTEWYGSPRTAWGMANGMTEIARDLPYADKRVELERAAGRVLQMAF